MSVGYENFHRIVSILNYTKEDLVEMFKLEKMEDLDECNAFDILASMDNEIKEIVLNAICFLTKQSAVFKEDCIILDCDNLSENVDEWKIICRDNYESFIAFMRLYNGLDNSENKEEEIVIKSTDSETVKDIKAKLIEGRIKRREANKRKAFEEGTNDSDLNIFTMISAVTAKSNNTNKMNVNDLTLFQLQDEFRRLSIIDGYDIQNRLLMVGAKPEKMLNWFQK